MENVVDPEVIELAKKLKAKRLKDAAKRVENLDKYPHAKKETLQFDSAANKYSVEIECTKCGEARRVFTSDLFQVTTCEDCAKESKAEKKAAKKAKIAAALALLEKQGQE